jgi:hypothetical protein
MRVLISTSTRQRIFVTYVCVAGSWAVVGQTNAEVHERSACSFGTHPPLQQSNLPVLVFSSLLYRLSSRTNGSTAR